MPAQIQLLRLVPVNDDQPGSLTSHIRRLERIWRESQEQLERERVLRLTNSEIETLEATG